VRIGNISTLNNIKHFPVFAVSINIEENKVRGVLNHLPKTTLYIVFVDKLCQNQDEQVATRFSHNVY